MSGRMIGIYGAGGAGRGVLPIVRASNPGAELVFIDDARHTEACNGHAILSFEEFVARAGHEGSVVLAVSDGELRRILAARVTERGIAFVQAIASGVTIMDDVQIGEGAILSPGTVITSNIVIGRHFQANLHSYVEHDCRIGDFVTFAPSVRCNGNVSIGDGAYIGCGAMIRQGRPGQPLLIGAGAVVGMGAVVLEDVPAGATVVGNPARILRRV